MVLRSSIDAITKHLVKKSEGRTNAHRDNMASEPITPQNLDASALLH